MAKTRQLTPEQKEHQRAYGRQYYQAHRAEKIAYQKSDPVRYMLWGARVRARRKGLEFTLKSEDVKIPEYCPITGIKITIPIGPTGGAPVLSAPSLDRVDPSKGYTPDNTMVVSFLGNAMKNTTNYEDMLNTAKMTVLSLSKMLNVVPTLDLIPQNAASV
jgi:hypothetical protein